MVNKLCQLYSSILGKFTQSPISPTPCEAHLHQASILFTLLACALLVLKPPNRALLYTFHSLLMTFIAHSIVFGYFRVLIGSHWVGMNSAIVALTCFIRAGMDLRERKQLGGLVIVGGGVASLLWSMNTATIKDKKLVDAAKWMVAVASPLIVLAKMPLLFGPRQTQLVPASLLTIASGLRMSSFNHWYDRALSAFMITNFTANLAETLMAILSVISERSKHKLTSRHSSRLKKKL